MFICLFIYNSSIALKFKHVMTTLFSKFLGKFFITIVILRNFNLVRSMNVELIFHLQDFFKSDLILIVIDNEDCNLNSFTKFIFSNFLLINFYYTFAVEIIKKFYKFKPNQARGFIGVINIDQDFEKFFETKYFSSYQNIILVLPRHTNFLKKLAKLNDLRLIGDMVWVDFITEDYSKELDDLYIPFNCRFFIIRKINDLSYKIQDVYQIGKNSLKIYSHFADWKNGEMKVFVKDFFSKRMNMKGHNLTITNSSVSDK